MHDSFQALCLQRVHFLNSTGSMGVRTTPKCMKIIVMFWGVSDDTLLLQQGCRNLPSFCCARCAATYFAGDATR